MTELSRRIAEWVYGLSLDHIPGEVVTATKLRILDIIGAMMAGRDMALVGQLRAAHETQRCESGIPQIGLPERVPPGAAALIQGTMACVQEYDDSHVTTGIHPGSPVVAAALAAGLQRGVSGPDLIVAVLGGIETACRLGLVAPGVFHRNGLHPTAMVAVFGCGYTVARLQDASAAEIMDATGICGSMAAGIMASWEDGSSAKSLHAGLAAAQALQAVALARHGVTGPATVYDGRFGFFRSHVQDPDINLDFDAVTRDLGTSWEILNIASRAFPCGHYIQAFVDAALELTRKEPINLDDIEEIVCPVTDYMVPLVCEPRDEKLAPKTAWHARYSLQYCLAEALVTGDLDKNSFAEADVAAGRFAPLMRKVRCFADTAPVDRTQWCGEVRLRMKDGRELRHRVEYLRGTPQNPMSEADIVRKFTRNAAGVMPPDAVDGTVETLLALDRCDDVREIFDGRQWRG